MTTPRIAIPIVEAAKVIVVDGWMNLKTAAAYIGCHEEHMRLSAASGKVRAGKDGNHWKFQRVDLDEYLRRGAR